MGSGSFCRSLYGSPTPSSWARPRMRRSCRPPTKGLPAGEIFAFFIGLLTLRKAVRPVAVTNTPALKARAGRSSHLAAGQIRPDGSASTRQTGPGSIMTLARPNCSIVQALVARCAVGRAMVKAEGPAAMASGNRS